jgi:hypothetical protein
MDLMDHLKLAIMEILIQVNYLLNYLVLNSRELIVLKLSQKINQGLELHQMR